MQCLLLTKHMHLEHSGELSTMFLLIRKTACEVSYFQANISTEI